MSEKKDITIEAQNYGLNHKLKSVFSPGGIQRAISEIGSSKYKDRMDTLREADDSMRETARLFKDYLRNAEKAFKDNRYLDVAHWCSMINDGVKLMIKDAKVVVDLQNSEIAEYYTRHDDANPEHNYFSADDGLVSTAGFLDKLFGNSIEKLYWKKVRASKLAVQSLVSKTEKLVAITYSSLDRMGHARAKGNIGGWLEDLGRISKAQEEFQVFAKGIYDQHLRELANIVKTQPKVEENVSQLAQNIPENADLPEEKVEVAPDSAASVPSNSSAATPATPVSTPESEKAKFEKGRPALNDPRSVQKQNDKELEQWEKIQQALLKGNQVEKPVVPEVKEQEKAPEVKNEVAPAVSEPVKTPEKVEVPKVEVPKVEVPKVEVPKVEPVKVEKVEPKVEPVKVEPKVEPVKVEKVEPKVEPVKVEEPAKVEPKVEPVKVEVPKPEAIKPVAPIVVEKPVAPQVPKAPTEINVTEAPKRGRGRPRKNPLPDNVQKSVPVESNVPPPSVIKNDTQESDPFDTDSTPALNVPKPVKTAPKNEPVHVDIQGKTPKDEGQDEKLKSKRDKTFDDAVDKKVTLVLIPKIKPDNLNEVKDELQKQLGHPIRFVTKDNGASIAQELKDRGFELDAMVYDEALKKLPVVQKQNPLELLRDPEYVATLPRMGNGHLDPIILDNVPPFGLPSKYPAFQHLDKQTRDAVVARLKEINAEKSNQNSPFAIRNKVEKPKDVPVSSKVEEKAAPVPSKVEEKAAPVEKSVPESKELSEDEIDQEVYLHGGIVERLLGKSLKDVTGNDALQLMNNKEYLDSLPRLPSDPKAFDMKLIAKFPEVKLLKTDTHDSTRVYFDVLKGLQTGKLPYPKTKAASVESAMIKVAHRKFMIELEKVAKTQNVGLMAAMMCKYSEEIENIDPVTSIELLLQAEKLLA